MGTPDFAVPSLERLLSEGYPVELVVTQPDRPSGRGQKLQAPPVKQLAESKGLRVLQPESLRKDPESLAAILACPCDFLVVVAYGQILPTEILDHPRVAPLNVHASLLPAYRGAAPIARSIMEMESETGVMIQWMVEALDMGDILYQIPFCIEESDTAQALHDRLSTAGAQALSHCLRLFETDQIERKAQDPRIGSYASKLKKEERAIRFDQPAGQLHRKIMGMNPWPVAECQILGERLRIFRSEFVARRADSEPGTILDLGEGRMVVACSEACIGILEVQQDSKRRMSVADYLKSNPLRPGMILGSLA